MSRKPHIQTIDTAELLEHAAAFGHTVGERAADAGRKATALAYHGKDWAEPRVGAAREWASPKVEHAWREGVKVAAPKVESAASAAKPAVEGAHDKIVEEYLPKLVAAVNAAAAAAASAADKVEERVDKRLDAIAGAAHRVTAPPVKVTHPVRNTVGWVLVGAAVAGGGYLLWKRTKPIDDPWAEEYWDDVAEVGGAKPVTGGPSTTAAPTGASPEAEAIVESPPMGSDIADAQEKPGDAGPEKAGS
jgi:hypothetical protein